mgnify:CR=1 FL=1
MEQFSNNSNRCTSQRKRVSNIGAMCKFLQNEDTFSIYFDLWNITLPKMVRNNILERCKKNLQVLLQETASWNLSDAWRRNRITRTTWEPRFFSILLIHPDCKNWKFEVWSWIKCRSKTNFQCVNLSEVHKLLRMKVSLARSWTSTARKIFSGLREELLITMIAFVTLKHSLQWKGEFHLYLGPVPEYLLVNSTARRFLTTAGVQEKFLSSSLYFMPCSLTIFGSAGIWADNLCPASQWKC